MRTIHTTHNAFRLLQRSQKGQVLLIVILLATVLLTVGLSITQITTQDAKVAKLQEDAAKARAAAEAGIEAALGQAGNDSIDISGLLSDDALSGTASFDTSVAPEFTTPLISKDAQYTFYLIGYDTAANLVLTGTFSDDMILNRVEPSATDYCSTAQAFAVELTFVDATPVTGGIVERFLIDECNLLSGTTAEFAFGDTIPSSSITPDPHVVIARVIAPNNGFNGAKLEFVNNTSGSDWPAQGRTVISTASVGNTENQNVTKKVRLFQSHPQFPAEFFVTKM